MRDRPNILLIVSDQERHRGWIPDELHRRLRSRERLLAEGREFATHYTHSSPCSPSRATLLTGQYVPEHGVTDNVFVDPVQPDLHTGTPTLGHLLRAAGYYTAYVGKWHLSYGNPNMEAYGFSDWTGEDWAWTGLAGTGTFWDPLIARRAIDWLDVHGRASEPWFLVVGLLNPHDIAWYPADQRDYQAANSERTAQYRRLLPAPIPGKPAITPFEADFGELFELPANFEDDLASKPAVQKQWQWEENHTFFGFLEHDDERMWRRALDYYWKLHELSDVHLGGILDALDATGRADDTVVIFTSDHGEMCASHRLRGKGPFAYEEIMRVPLYVRAPGLTEPASRSEALTSSADIASTVCALARVRDTESLSGVDLTPLLTGEATEVRDHILFAQAQGWHRSCIATRYALRGYFDGRYKYVRYFGVGGSTDSSGRGLDWLPEMRFGPGAGFADHEHELYDLQEDPGEVVNLAHDRGRRGELRDRFARLLELEAAAFRHSRPEGLHDGSTHRSAMMEEAGVGARVRRKRDRPAD